MTLTKRGPRPGTLPAPSPVSPQPYQMSESTSAKGPGVLLHFKLQAEAYDSSLSSLKGRKLGRKTENKEVEARDLTWMETSQTNPC